MNENPMQPEEFDPMGEGSDNSKDNAGTETSTVLMSVGGFTFDTLVGFDEEIQRLKEMGIIEGAKDEDFVEFVEQMKAQHGLYNEPTGKAVLFHGDVREDADRLMIAVATEIGHPTVRMRIFEPQPGIQAICIMSTPGMTVEGFKDWGTLVLEGVDSWGAPDGLDNGFSIDEMALANAARGTMKAISLIRDAAANPKVTILVSASVKPDSHSFISGLVGPMTTFEVPRPSREERDDIWDHLMHKHVSMSAIDRFELVCLSEGMPRCDIFAAAREAVSQAYHESIEKRIYTPVDRANLLNKIAAYQPLDSEEYRWIEESVVEDFRDEIERFERGEL